MGVLTVSRDICIIYFLEIKVLQSFIRVKVVIFPVCSAEDRLLGVVVFPYLMRTPRILAAIFKVQSIFYVCIGLSLLLLWCQQKPEYHALYILIQLHKGPVGKTQYVVVSTQDHNRTKICEKQLQCCSVDTWGSWKWKINLLVTKPHWFSCHCWF